MADDVPGPGEDRAYQHEEVRHGCHPKLRPASRRDVPRHDHRDGRAGCRVGGHPGAGWNLVRRPGRRRTDRRGADPDVQHDGADAAVDAHPAARGERGLRDGRRHGRGRRDHRLPAVAVGDGRRGDLRRRVRPDDPGDDRGDAPASVAARDAAVQARSDVGATVASSSAQRAMAAPRAARAAPSGTALIAGVCGLLANVAYALAASELLGDVATPIAASLFGPLIAAMSVALYCLLASERATLAGLLAAIANVAAAALVTAMVLVQIAVNDVEAGLSPAVNDAFEHVEFGRASCRERV